MSLKKTTDGILMALIQFQITDFYICWLNGAYVFYIIFFAISAYLSRWRGDYGGQKKAWFPSNYVEELLAQNHDAESENVSSIVLNIGVDLIMIMFTIARQPIYWEKCRKVPLI